MQLVTEYHYNIYDCFQKASEEDVQQGLTWYSKAHQIAVDIADIYSLGIKKVCGVIAILSPGNTWEKNIKDTKTLIYNFCEGMQLEDMPKVGAYGTRNMLKAFKVLQGYNPIAVIGGLKVANFYVCVLYPDNTLHVCLDRHAVCIAVGERLGEKYTKYLIGTARYNLIADSYREVAAMVGILPNQLQAITWCSWRRKHNAKVDKFM